jgi:hypothetical protein
VEGVGLGVGCPVKLSNGYHDGQIHFRRDLANPDELRLHGRDRRTEAAFPGGPQELLRSGKAVWPRSDVKAEVRNNDVFALADGKVVMYLARNVFFILVYCKRPE